MSTADYIGGDRNLGDGHGERQALYQHVTFFKPQNNSKCLLETYKCKIQERFDLGAIVRRRRRSFSWRLKNPHKTEKTTPEIDFRALSFLGIKILNF